jgi:hypothetical protein
MNTTVCNSPNRFQRREQEEVGVVSKSNIIIGVLPFHNTQLDDGWRIDWPSIGGSCQSLARGISSSARLSAYTWHRNHMPARVVVVE